MTVTDPRAFLTALFDAAVAAADPLAGIRRHLPRQPKGRTIVIGAGKGSAQMAAALDSCWDGPLEGLVVTRYGFAVACERIEIVEASHPVPDRSGLDAATRLLRLVQGLSADDLVIALISGGGSALLPSPAGGLTLDDEIAVNRALLASGAPISVMNTIRKHISTIKGGRLAVAAYPAKVVTLVVSDIPGDNPALVASGPTIAGAGDRADALDLIRQYSLALPANVLAHIASPQADAPATDDPRFARNEVHVIASAGVSLEAAANASRAFGIEAAILSDAIEGEAREAARVHAAIAREIAARNRPFAKPVVLLSGGETTVTVAGDGKGGRNSEFLLSLAIDIDGFQGIDAMAADTDGIDGSENNAGAFADGSSAVRMRAAGIVPADHLRNNDAWSAFHAIGDLFAPGPTGTNVNDFRAILIR
ncbi:MULTISPECIES: glycerate kinase type-2 family protein [unclassified Rhizobium]|uniref:glycerate kinase type-2 family protein n=1 Tax=unclassified Rhizobium TaxID=2613769 RepID=UPI001ADCB0B8|nr:MULTISPECIES: glycerate kinase [unclassified Rhizobium]MBO9099330.1 glycerate kinase [Rhizobium sp. L58/93]MBO9169593.1 glycerate kinase [Rhizobium sp. L245/93]MBO9185543.1 glycerate kinase [Rhizobium sp. E27B/91]QXZ85671.1 glycerate kinase [Rhizobium sp. K1/93]QXZ90189.1 glycerate kinase [Rhizobium sp. K15/93]